MEAVSAVLPPDLAFSGDDSNRKFGGPFCHFGIFVFNSFDVIICLKDRQGIVPKHIVD
jgi:hypothetical protein